MAGSQRMTYSDSLSQYLRSTGVKTSDPNYAGIVADFNQNLSARYQMVLAKMADYKTQKQYTSTTVASQALYPYPAGMVNFETVVITIGSLNYPLQVINAQWNWDIYNAIPFQPTTFPQFVFPDTDGYRIWPVPSDAWPITFNYHWRDRSLSIADYTDGTIAVTANSAAIVGTATTFTQAMVGRWFSVTDPTAVGQGYWYRVVSVTDTTHATLYRPYQGTTGSGYSYVIGESFEIPEEGHMAIVQGAVADFYANLKNDESSAARWENRFWTGDPSNPTRKFGDNDVFGGVIGLVNKYEDRNESHIVERQPRVGNPRYKAFGIVLSGS